MTSSKIRGFFANTIVFVLIEFAAMPIWQIGFVAQADELQRKALQSMERTSIRKAKKKEECRLFRAFFIE